MPARPTWPRPAIGFGKSERDSDDQEAINRLFAPEFRNRLDAIVPFGNLPPEVVHQVVQKFVLQLEAQLADRGVTFDLSEEAVKWLAEKGYDSRMGARPLGRVIQEHIKQPLADEVLFGKLQKGGTVKVTVKEGRRRPQPRGDRGRPGQAEARAAAEAEARRARAPTDAGGEEADAAREQAAERRHARAGAEGAAEDELSKTRRPLGRLSNSRVSRSQPSRRGFPPRSDERAPDGVLAGLFQIDLGVAGPKPGAGQRREDSGSPAPQSAASRRERRTSAQPVSRAGSRAKGRPSHPEVCRPVIVGLGGFRQAQRDPPEVVPRHQCGESRRDRLAELLGVRGEHLLILHLAGVRLERHAVEARDDVEVEVEDGLAGGRLVELDHRHAVGVEGALRGPRDLLHGAHQRAEGRRVGVEDVARGRRGTTRVWPVPCGITSMKATTWSSS